MPANALGPAVFGSSFAVLRNLRLCFKFHLTPAASLLLLSPLVRSSTEEASLCLNKISKSYLPKVCAAIYGFQFVSAPPFLQSNFKKGYGVWNHLLHQLGGAEKNE